jgi:hypothetical protein
MPVEDGVEKVLGISNDEDRKSRVSCVGLTVGAVRELWYQGTVRENPASK